MSRGDKGIGDLNGKGYAWKTDPYWVSWGTMLDDTGLIYFLPETYEMMACLTGKRFDYVEAQLGDIVLYIVGFYRGEQPFGPFWHEHFTDHLKDLSPRMKCICAFVKLLQEDIDASDANKVYEWMRSYRESNSYLSLHRGIVKEVGKLLGVDMNDHDLTKSRAVQIALGFLWHWDGEREGSEELSCLKETALDCIHAGHLEVENHHPEHEKASVGCVDIHKLFADRLSVHLQKDPIDKRKGWDINMNFIPIEYREEWVSFAAKHEMVDLYHALSDALWKQWLGERQDQLHWCQRDKSRLVYKTSRITSCDWIK